MLRRRILLVLVALCSSTAWHYAGRWSHMNESVLPTDEYASYYTWKGPPDNAFDDNTALMTSYTVGSPCRALSIRDNCFSHNPDRAQELLQRTFIPLHSKAKHYVNVAQPNTLAGVLAELRNKSIMFLGDSTVVSVFTSLVCHLSQQETATYKLTWLYEREHILRDEDGQTKCPHHVSCYLLSGHVVFTQHNITIGYRQMNAYSKASRTSLLSIVDSDYTRPDIVILNFGVHYNDHKSYISGLLHFKNDMHDIVERQKNTSSQFISYHWIESFPQHFTHGFYNYSADRHVRTSNYHLADTANVLKSFNHTTNLHCKPIANTTQYHIDDWRNRLAELFLADFYLNHRAIKLAEPLYEQWDAHVDYGDSRRVLKYGADCTHYCTGSGVFRFVLSEVLTGIKRSLHSGPDKYFFYPERPAPPKVDKRKETRSKVTKAHTNCINLGDGGLRRRHKDPNC